MAIEQEDVDQGIGGLPPWVSEDTLAKIASHKQTENSKLKAVYRSLTGVPFDSDAITKAYEESGDKLEAANNVLVKMESGVKNLFSVTSRDTDPLEATAELMKLSVGAISDTVGGITSFTQFLGPKGAALSWIANGVVATGVAAVGVAAVFAKLISEQEKGLRQIIDYGGVVGDMSQYTEMRGSLVNVGMSMQEMSKIMIGNKAMLANMPGNLMATTMQFINFAGKVESETSQTMGDFGYNVEQQTARLLEEANLMYMTGQMQQFGEVTKEKIRKNFEQSSAMTTFLADKFGDQRSSLLSLRSEAMTNIDFMTAMAMNGEYLAEKYGENAEENVRNTGANLKMLFSTVLGPQFGEQTENVFNNFLKDVNIDASVLNNMPKEMVNMLSALGPEVSSKFTNLLEQAGTGQVTQPELVMRVQELTKSIAKATPRYGDDPMIIQQNNLIAQARQAPEAFMELTKDQLDSGLANVMALSDVASDSINAIDAARIAFRSVVHDLTPGYELGAIAVSAFESSLKLVESSLEFLGIIPTDKKIPNIRKNTEALKKVLQEPGPSTMGNVAKKMSDTLSGKVDTESPEYKRKNVYALAVAARKKALEKEKEEKYNAAYTNSYNILNKNFSPDQFAEGGGPVPILHPNGRWYAKIKDANAPIGSKKVYIDELNVVGMKINSMYQLDSMITKKMREITKVLEKTVTQENMHGD